MEALMHYLRPGSGGCRWTAMGMVLSLILYSDTARADDPVVPADVSATESQTGTSPGLSETAAARSTAQSIVRREYTDSGSGTVTPYVLYPPAAETPAAERSLLIFFYGAGGSLKSYNFSRPPYATLREQLARRGYYVVVPELGPLHFMNDIAKSAVDGVVAQVLKQQGIPSDHVHVMGTSMGAGSSLAYAIHRPDMIRSVCAVMPMTDFGVWVMEKPAYRQAVANAFGGTSDQVPDVYAENSAVKNVSSFKDIPVMLVHGTADSIVRYSHSEKLARLLRENGSVCELCTVNKLAHTDEVMQDFQIQAADFFDAAVK